MIMADGKAGLLIHARLLLAEIQGVMSSYTNVPKQLHSSSFDGPSCILGILSVSVAECARWLWLPNHDPRVEMSNFLVEPATSAN